MKNIKLILSVFAMAFFIASCSDDEEPMPVATANPASQVITSGETTSVDLSSTIAGTTFSWTVTQNGVTGASSGSGSTIAQALTVSGVETGTATYTVVPTANGVVGNSITVVITVNLAKTTYVANVKPILTASCTPCHLAGGTHPSKWDVYATAKSNINSIIDRVKREPGTSGFMPKNGSKLSADKIAILEKWVADGLLEQ
ncbi:MAG TPA: PKD-like domain-containing protein [Draconibacterium sp.]|nr:PKD-like domain-containing protein [Draconibacterium sp.]